jgi:hypothetical protein
MFQAKDGRPQQAKSKEVINVEVINVEDTNSQPVLNNIDGNNNEKAFGSQPVLNNIDENNNENASGSSSHEIRPNHGGPILSLVDPNEVLRLQDKQLEAEINDASDDSWSTDS